MLQPAVNSQGSERRFHPRQQVLYSLMLLGNDNGGVVLNISETGLAMSAVRSLTDDLLHMRFQLSETNTWIEAQGRIAWTNASKQTVGVQFVGLPYEGRKRIKRWLASIDRLSEPAKENPPVEGIAPTVRLASAALEPASTVSISEPATPAEVIEDSKRDPGDLPEFPPIDDQTENLELVSQYFRATADPSTIMDGNELTKEIALERPASSPLESRKAASASEPKATERIAENPEQEVEDTNPVRVLPETSEERDFEKNATPVAAGNIGSDTHPPLYLSYEETPPARSDVGRELARRTGPSRLWLGVLLFLLFPLAYYFFFGHHFRRERSVVEAPTTPSSQPAAPSSGTVIPKNQPESADLAQPLNRAGFVLQVGAMTYKENADALLESLRNKHFPAFVSHHENERFYLVLVGPYGDATSAVKAKTDLKAAGFESIQTPWKPTAQPSGPADSH